jgi:CII-binding regulator of phage lambda lysogenization HflD
LMKALFVFTPLVSGNPSETSVVVGDKEKSIDTGLMKLSLALDDKSDKRQQEMTIDFTNANYSSITSQAQLRLSKVPMEVIDPQIQKLMSRPAGEPIR